MFNQKILRIIDELQKRSNYEQEHKDEFSEENRMLAITRDTGEFYNLLLKALGVKRILEIGLSHGYSTLWFADAILSENPSNSCVITIEKDHSKVKIAQENFRKAGIENFVTVKHGDGIKILNEMLEDFNKNFQKDYFDFVFIDADKENSIQYFELCLPMIRKNGIIAADNILDMKEMEEYTKYVKNRSNIQTVTLPIGWGQELSLKLQE
ncbi:MAG: O-methyltransferase [Nitrosopumilus sp.]|nr:O-methyltransferase [Nitrosopumilus sp.]MDH3737017.1 O-methyltransferase [Nitrosopumilus sp.]MDH3834350.1 O-methyltransferase [Nitrosopumilus sp.]